MNSLLAKASEVNQWVGDKALMEKELASLLKKSDTAISPPDNEL